MSCDSDALIAARIRGRMGAHADATEIARIRQGKMAHSRSASRTRVRQLERHNRPSQPAHSLQPTTYSSQYAVQPVPSMDERQSNSSTASKLKDASHSSKTKRSSPSRQNGLEDISSIRQRIHAQATQHRKAMRGETETSPFDQEDDAIQSNYPMPNAHLPLPAIPSHATFEKVFDWFARVLHIDLIQIGDQHHHDHDEGGIMASTLPPPRVDSPFWSSLTASLSDGVQFASIAVALEGELPGVRTNPRRSAEKRFNWSLALETLRLCGKQSSICGSDGRPPSPRRASVSQKGSGVVPFSLLFHLDDVAHELHPVTLWCLLAMIYSEYSPRVRSRQWLVSPVSNNRLERRDVTVRAFIGPTDLQPQPTPIPPPHTMTTDDDLHESASYDSPSLQSRHLDRSRRRSTSRSRASPSPHRRPLTPRGRSASPAGRVAAVLAASPEAHSSSPLTSQSYHDLQTTLDTVEQTAWQQEFEARHRPIVFQSSNAQRDLWTRRGVGMKTQEQFATVRLGQSRPNDIGIYYGPQTSTEQTSPTPSSNSTSNALPSTALIDWSNWPPVQQIDAVQEKIVRTWLADEMNLYVLPSQENGQTQGQG